MKHGRDVHSAGCHIGQKIAGSSVPTVQVWDIPKIDVGKKPKDGKLPPGAANFLEVMLSDEAATLQQLNRLCGSENIFSHTRVPRRRVPVEVPAGGADPTPQIVGDGLGADRDAAVRSKILSHFIKGRISLSPMETILLIPKELEHLESLVKLARRRKDTDVHENQVSMVFAAPTLRRVYVNKTHRSKTLHMLGGNQQLHS